MCQTLLHTDLTCVSLMDPTPTPEHAAQKLWSCTQDTGFFRGWGGAWDSSYGRFFMKWYSDQLLLHGERLCKIAASIFNTSRPQRCTSRYHSSHPTSPLNPMSLVSDLASVLRPSHQQAASACQSESELVTESQSMLLQHDPLRATADLVRKGLMQEGEATATTPDEPLTPVAGSAVKPSSWPKAEPQISDKPGQEQLHFSSFRSELTQQQAGDPMQDQSRFGTQSSAVDSSSQAEAGPSQLRDSNQGNAEQMFAPSSVQQAQQASKWQADSMQFASKEDTPLSRGDSIEANCGQQCVNRYICCARRFSSTDLMTFALLQWNVSYPFRTLIKRYMVCICTLGSPLH